MKAPEDPNADPFRCRPPKSGKREVAGALIGVCAGLGVWTGLMIWRDQAERVEQMIQLLEVLIWPSVTLAGAMYGQHSAQTQGPWAPRWGAQRGRWGRDADPEGM